LQQLVAFFILTMGGPILVSFHGENIFSEELLNHIVLNFPFHIYLFILTSLPAILLIKVSREFPRQNFGLTILLFSYYVFIAITQIILNFH
jgi:hypothetical protein